MIRDDPVNAAVVDVPEYDSTATVPGAPTDAAANCTVADIDAPGAIVGSASGSEVVGTAVPIFTEFSTTLVAELPPVLVIVNVTSRLLFVSRASVRVTPRLAGPEDDCEAFTLIRTLADALL